MSDANDSLADLKQAMQTFVDERRWRPFHDPKNLSMAIATEAAELMEHFRWLSNEESRAIARSESDMQAVRDELADIMCFVLSFANSLNIDIASAIRSKLVKNAEKYPVEKFQGRFR